MRFPSYSLPELTPDQNAAYSRNLFEIERQLYAPAVRLQLAGDQAFLAGQQAGVVWDVVDFDTATIVQHDGNDSLIHCRMDGTYHISGAIQCSNIVGNIDCFVRHTRGATTTDIDGDAKVSDAALNRILKINVTYRLLVGDTLEVIVGMAANGVVMAVTATHFEIVRISE